MPKKAPRSDIPESESDEPFGEMDRNEDFSDREDFREALRELHVEVQQGLQDQWQRSNEIMDYWEIFNCELGANQYYSGTSHIFLPIVHNAVNARMTRFVNQIFPVSGRNVEVTTEDGVIPHAEMSLVEFYIRRAQLRTKVIPALLRNGDIEGQYNIYVSWDKKERHVTWRTPDPVGALEEMAYAEDEVGPIQHDVISDAGPHVEVLADADVLVLPQTSDSVEDALAAGGSVTIVRRWTKSKIKKMIRSKDIDKEKGEALLKAIPETKGALKDKQKEMVKAAGIRGKIRSPSHAVVLETWAMLTVDDQERRLCRMFFAGDNMTLSAMRNPFWSDRCPLISVPVDKIEGALKGISKVHPCAQVQYYANDVVNEAADSSMFALMPIVMTDPEKNPRVGSMVLSLGAIWETSPKDTQFAAMPELWRQGFEIVASCKAEIAQSLSVSPAAITQGGAVKSKQSQAEVAREQQVDILSTADAVTVLEEGVLTPIVNRFMELDHQFRDDPLLIPEFGEMGRRAKMETIEPIQFGKRYSFRWFGVEAARTAQQIQQQIAMVNVLRGIPPQQYEGRRLNLVPVISQLVENTFGPRLAPLVFEDTAAHMPLPVDQENMLLSHGFETAVHPMDDDQQHILGHAQLLQLQGAGHANKIKRHIFEHMQAMQRKQQAMQQAMMAPPQGLPGAPGGAGPGMAGTPRIGAMPGAPRMQGPPGMISQDQIGPQSGGMPRLRQRGM